VLYIIGRYLFILTSLHQLLWSHIYIQPLFQHTRKVNIVVT